MSTYTPYDADIADAKAIGDDNLTLLAGGGREGYLRAIADMKPRHDALVAAARTVVKIYRADYRDQTSLDIPLAIARLEDALKAAGEEA